LNPGERSGVSWITTESRDRAKANVIVEAVNDIQFAVNLLLTAQQPYCLPSVGKSLRRTRVKDGDLVGIKAKTLCPAKREA
jgi:hypothetical protein